MMTKKKVTAINYRARSCFLSRRCRQWLKARSCSRFTRDPPNKRLTFSENHVLLGLLGRPSSYNFRRHNSCITYCLIQLFTSASSAWSSEVFLCQHCAAQRPPEKKTRSQPESFILCQRYNWIIMQTVPWITFLVLGLTPSASRHRSMDVGRDVYCFVGRPVDELIAPTDMTIERVPYAWLFAKWGETCPGGQNDAFWLIIMSKMVKFM